MTKRADFYLLPLPCENGHEQYEPLSRWIHGPGVICSHCGEGIVVSPEVHQEIRQIIDDFDALDRVEKFSQMPHHSQE